MNMNLLYEICSYIRHERKWWLAPLLFLLLLISLLVAFADSAVAPFLYSLF